MKCPSCNKFAGLESQDPEVDEEFDAESGQVTASARLVAILKNIAASKDGLFHP